MDLHARIRWVRELRGFGQAELAKRVRTDEHPEGVTPATFYRYELRGLTPGLDVLIWLAEECDCTLDWLLTGRGPAPTRPDSAGDKAPETSAA